MKKILNILPIVIVLFCISCEKPAEMKDLTLYKVESNKYAVVLFGISEDNKIFSIETDSTSLDLVLPIKVSASIKNTKAEIASDLSKATRYVTLPNGEVVVPCIVIRGNNGRAEVYNGFKSARCGNPSFDNSDYVKGSFFATINPADLYKTGN